MRASAVLLGERVHRVPDGIQPRGDLPHRPSRPPPRLQLPLEQDDGRARQRGPPEVHEARQRTV